MLDEDFSALSQIGAQLKEYRMTVARNLLHRFFLEHDLDTLRNQSRLHSNVLREEYLMEHIIRKISGAAHSNRIHESATKHVTGQAKVLLMTLQNQ